ncbi:DUF2938 domain-containing protein [Lacimicrobium alkaliphilum]|uniref:DUF2938 domain-containing protein n=1 Tax=Lacimicrobium alkaliphilum TaxID=1526571 RepID=A0A0U2Z346_9ALTE|nr:DUF2938 domain-containing protein [Lacimicrobium alkaliphilum]ALS96868.1 hypothetical protein AT746_00305 [Lacimicrobium alkaliphilum]
MQNLLSIVIIGIGATAVMDLWGALRKPLLGVPPPNYAMLGRWIAHMTHGQFCHKSIAASPSIAAEQIIGWVAHYLTGIAFAALLIGISGPAWIQNPTMGPAFAVGTGTIAAPFLLMQPGMGAGFAGSKMPNPNAARLQSLLTHMAFGLGLYLSGLAVSLIC